MGHFANSRCGKRVSKCVKRVNNVFLLFTLFAHVAKHRPRFPSVKGI